MGNIILGADGIVARQNIYEQSSKLMNDLGRKMDFSDGRRFRYCKCNSSAGITKGHMCSAGTVDANHNTVTQTANAVTLSLAHVGAKVIWVLLATAADKNDYADGFLTIEGGTGLGQMYKIKSNTAAGASVADLCKLTLYDPILVALDDTSIISLTKSKYKDVVVTPVTTEVAPPVGVPLITITADYYFWAQVRGYCAIVADTGDTLTVGMGVSGGNGVGTTVAGAVVEETTTLIYKRYGICIQIAAADGYATIDLQLE